MVLVIWVSHRKCKRNLPSLFVFMYEYLVMPNQFKFKLNEGLGMSILSIMKMSYELISLKQFNTVESKDTVNVIRM